MADQSCWKNELLSECGVLFDPEAPDFSAEEVQIHFLAWPGGWYQPQEWVEHQGLEALITVVGAARASSSLQAYMSLQIAVARDSELS